MSDLSFAQPWVLAGLALTAGAFAVWVIWSQRGARRAAVLTRGPTPGPRYAVAVLLAAAAACAVVAGARPRWGEEQLAAPRRGTDLVIVLDVSRSMGAQDVAPNRLEAAKAAIAATFQRLAGDRVGLVIFGGSARVRFPLTTDIDAAVQVVRTLETGSVLVEAGSQVDSGLDIALGMFSTESPGGRVVLLISDGEDLGDPAGTGESAAKLHANGVDLIVAGVGTLEGGNVPIYDARAHSFRPLIGRDGAPVVSRLNEPLLRLVARAGEGRYVGPDTDAIAGSVAGRVAALRQRRTEADSTSVPVERFQWFAGAAVALLVLASMAEHLPAFRRRQLLLAPAAVVLALVAGGCQTHAHDLNEQGRDAYARGDYGAAVESFQGAQVEQPDNPRLTLNLATALHAAQRYDEAARAARRALLSPDEGVQAKGYASLGHHLFAMGRQAEALDAFKQALLRNPADDASRHDYEVLLRILNGESAPGQSGDEGGTPGDSNNPDPIPEPSPPAGGSSSPPSGASADSGTERPADLEDLNRQIAEIDQEIQRLYDGAEGTPSAAQALRILTLISERNRLAGLRSAYSGANNPGDY